MCVRALSLSPSNKYVEKNLKHTHVMSVPCSELPCNTWNNIAVQGRGPRPVSPPGVAFALFIVLPMLCSWENFQSTRDRFRCLVSLFTNEKVEKTKVFRCDLSWEASWLPLSHLIPICVGTWRPDAMCPCHCVPFLCFGDLFLVAVVQFAQNTLL